MEPPSQGLGPPPYLPETTLYSEQPWSWGGAASPAHLLTPNPAEQEGYGLVRRLSSQECGVKPAFSLGPGGWDPHSCKERGAGCLCWGALNRQQRVASCWVRSPDLSTGLPAGAWGQGLSPCTLAALTPLSSPPDSYTWAPVRVSGLVRPVGWFERGGGLRTNVQAARVLTRKLLPSQELLPVAEIASSPSQLHRLVPPFPLEGGWEVGEQRGQGRSRACTRLHPPTPTPWRSLLPLREEGAGMSSRPVAGLRTCWLHPRGWRGTRSFHPRLHCALERWAHYSLLEKGCVKLTCFT